MALIRLTSADVLSDGERLASVQGDGPVDRIRRTDDQLLGGFDPRRLQHRFDQTRRVRVADFIGNVVTLRHHNHHVLLVLGFGVRLLRHLVPCSFSIIRFILASSLRQHFVQLNFN